jgi:hypothetical protein
MAAAGDADGAGSVDDWRQAATVRPRTRIVLDMAAAAAVATGAAETNDLNLVSFTLLVS